MNLNTLEAIEAEYDAYCMDRQRKTDDMYMMLSDCLKEMIAMTIKTGTYVDWDTVEELTQDVLTAIATEKIDSFQKEQAKFTTFCLTIAKNKALDFVRKRKHRREIAGEEIVEQTEDFLEREFFGNPEKLLVQQERKLEQIEALKKYLRLLMNQKGKPYRTLGCCYTMVLFHRYHPNSKELSSPKWAFEEVKETCVGDSADRFAREINEWFPRFHLYWGDAFVDGMDKKEDNIYISDMIFEEHFCTKDFENWSGRMRNRLRCELYEEICAVLE